MDVDPLGRVTQVEVEVAEGVGERLRERAIAAGYLTLFPPDPGRALPGRCAGAASCLLPPIEPLLGAWLALMGAGGHNTRLAVSGILRIGGREHVIWPSSSA